MVPQIWRVPEVVPEVQIELFTRIFFYLHEI